MAGDINGVLFVEDAAQATFLTALIEKVGAQIGLPAGRLNLEVRNSSGGKGQALKSYRNFIRDFMRGGPTAAFIVVSVDSDCRLRHDVAQEVRQLSTAAGYPGPVIAAIPVPHIERWYLLDVQAFRRATGGAVAPAMPDRCERDYYKNALIDALQQAGEFAPLAAAPYAEDYVAAMDINSARQRDNSFDSFYEELRECLVAYRNR